jgi:cytochrome c-type biogenesis protein CcmH
MTLFWALAAGMCAAALAFLLPPLLRRRVTPPDARTAANAAIYREQLEELGAELQRGALTREEYERACREVERRVVAEHADGGPVPATHRPRTGVALLVGVLLPVMAAVGYWNLGNFEGMNPVAGGEAGHSASPAEVEALVEKLAARMEQTPDDVEGWMLLGRSLSMIGRYDRAAQAYERAARLAPSDANVLADYADTLAMAQGRKLAGEPAALVKRALAADPEHVKALALAGSAAFEAGNYGAAVGYWERILKVLPPQSEFARSVAESIAEARAKGGDKLAQAPAAAKADAKAATKPAPAKPAAASGTSVQGVVSVDPAVAAKLSPGDTVFVLARPASGSRMPLAVARTTVAALPYRFTLDDSMAMAAGATISSQEKIVVVARVSKSGSAASQKGDIEGTSEAVAPGASGLKIVLSRVVD